MNNQKEFQIHRLTHPRDDACGIQSYYTQSVGPGNYVTNNLVPPAPHVNKLASEQPVVYPREGYGLNTPFIDTDSIIKNHPGFKSNRCSTRTQSRPFLTVPYMAGGRGNTDVESALLHSSQVRMGKECGTVTESEFDQQWVPMIPILRDNIQKPSNLIPEVAAKGWIHGGLPTRSYMTDTNC